MWIAYTICLVFISTEYIYGLEFPIKEFFDMKDITLDITELRKEFLCTVELDFFYKSCSCTPECLKYRSCCIDYLWDKNDAQLKLEVYIKQYLTETNKQKTLGCSALFNNKHLDVTSDHILMVKDCPPNYANKVYIDKCVNSNVSPVYVKNDTIYKNKFCAICWNSNNYKRLNLTAECHEKKTNLTDKKSVFEMYKDCHVTIATNEESYDLVRECSLDVVEDCMGDTIQCDLCHSYISGIKINSKCFRNIHCYEKNKMNDFWKNNYTYSCYEALPTKKSEASGYRIFLPRYSLMVSFDEQADAKLCANKQYFDDELQECIDELKCRIGYEVKNQKCVLQEDFPIENKVGVEGISKEEIIRNCIGHHNRYLHIHTNITNFAEQELLHRLTTLHRNNIMFQNNMSIIVNIKGYNPENLSKAILTFNYDIIASSAKFYLTNFYGVDFTRYFPRAKICASPILHSSYILYNNCTVHLNESKLMTRNYLILNKTDSNGKQTINVYTCEKFHLTESCALREIHSYKVLSNLSVQSKDKMFQATAFTPLQHGIGVCTTKPLRSSKQNNSFYAVDHIEGYLTIIGCICSIVGYIWLIFTYTCIRDLRTVPGKNIVALCVMLLISDAIMLFNMLESKSLYTCKAFAIILHFAGVSVQCWTVCVAFEIWTTFRGKSLKQNFRSQKRFLWYCAFSWITAFIIVFTCIVFDVSVHKIYGDAGICWIIDFKARLFSYIFVVIICTSFTVISLSYTLYQIYKQSKKSKKLLQKSGGETTSLVKMAWKLILLLGVIEVCGFIQVKSTNNNVEIINSIFRVLHTTVRSFRGVFIWLLYVVTGRVFNLYRGIRERRTYRSSTRFTSVSRSASKRYNKENNSLMETSYNDK